MIAEPRKISAYRVKKDLILPNGGNGLRLKEGYVVHADEISVREEFLSNNPDYFDKIPIDLVPMDSYVLLFEQNQELMKNAEYLQQTLDANQDKVYTKEETNNLDWLFEKLKGQLLKGCKYEQAAQIRQIQKSVQPAPKENSKEWEIVSFKEYCSGDTENPTGYLYAVTKEGKIGTFSNAMLLSDWLKKPNPIYRIHSVRRLSDNVVFSLDQDTPYGKIKGFEITDAAECGMYVLVDRYGDNKIGHISLHKIPTPSKTPSTNTSDKPVTNNDDVVCLSLNDCSKWYEAWYPNNPMKESFLFGLSQIVKQKLKNNI